MHVVHELVLRKLMVMFNEMAFKDADHPALLSFFEGLASAAELAVDGFVADDGVPIKHPPNGFFGMEFSSPGVTLTLGVIGTDEGRKESKLEIAWPVIETEQTNVVSLDDFRKR